MLKWEGEATMTPTLVEWQSECKLKGSPEILRIFQHSHYQQQLQARLQEHHCTVAQTAQS